MARVLLIDNFDSYSYNLVQLLWEVSDRPPTVVTNDVVDLGAIRDGAWSHVVISPGPGSPGRPEDVGACLEVLRSAPVPVLGVCLGHQSLAVAFGGTVHRAPMPMHGRLSTVCHDGTGLFRGIPSSFPAVRYHSLAVDARLPACLSPTAHSEDGVIMALAHRSLPRYGVQFHPESVGTAFGACLVANFLDLRPVTGLRGATRSAKPRADLTGPTTSATAPTISIRHRELDTSLDTAGLFDSLFRDSTYSFWLDGAAMVPERSRWSFMGKGGREGCLRSDDGGRTVSQGAQQEIGAPGRTVFDVLAGRLTAQPRWADGQAHPPLPFTGGFIGYLGYGVAECLGFGPLRAGPPGGPPGAPPDAQLMAVDRFLAVDHQVGRTYLVTAGLDAHDADHWFDTMEQRLDRSDRGEQTPPGRSAPVPTADSVPRETYDRHMGQIQQWLSDGESYEACYTYQICGISDQDPLEVYRRLRRANPAPYAAYLRMGEHRVLSSSPERFVTIDQDRWVESKPIKGTAARSDVPELDAAAIRSLREDEKTRAENLMIVDVLRNDLGRVCQPWTVTVPSLMDVETYATVHQLVSTVRGRLRDGVHPVAGVAALFPGGSMTGAPKRRTVQLLDSLEPAARGVYAGALGYFGHGGRIDLSIVIRSVVWDRTAFSIGVGGAITAMSATAAEYEETRVKARALLEALSAGGTGSSVDGVSVRRRDRNGTLDRRATLDTVLGMADSVA